MTKYQTRCNLRKGGFFFLAHSLKGNISPQAKQKHYVGNRQMFDIKFCCFGNGKTITILSCSWGGAPCYQNQNKQAVNRAYLIISSWWKLSYLLLDTKCVILTRMVFTSLCTVACSLVPPWTSCATSSQKGCSSHTPHILSNAIFSERASALLL